MPRIPDLVSTGGYGPAAQAPRVNPDLGAARAVAQLADTTGRLAQVLRERDVQAERARQAAEINRAEIEGRRWLAEQQAAIAAAPDPRPLVATFERAARDYGRQASGKLGVDEDARAQFSSAFEAAALPVLAAAQAASLRADRDQWRGELLTGLNDLELQAGAAASAPARAAADAAIPEMLARGVAGGYVGREEAARLGIETRQRVALARVQAALEADPAAVAAGTAPPGVAVGTLPGEGGDFQALAAQLVDGGLAQVESGGRQLNADGSPVTSPKGAVGLTQIMPGTGPEAAADAGLPWDERRWREDADYNRALGVGHLAKLLRRYGGDVTIALTAYNQGVGNVDRFLETIGDPRGQQLTHDAWLSRLPGPNGRAYARSVLARMGTTPAAIAAARQPVAPELAEEIARLPAAARLQLFRTSGERIEAQAREAERLAREAEAAAQAERNRRAVETARVAEESIASILATGAPVAGFSDADVIRDIAPDNPQAATRLLVQLDVAREGARATVGFAGLPAADIAAQVERLKPAEGADDFRFRQQIYAAATAEAQRVLAARAKDPAGTVAALPQLRALNEAARADPAQLPAYGRALLAEQQRLGVAPSQQRLIPEALAKQSVADLMATPPAQRPEAFREFVEATAGWGELAERARAEYVAAGLPREAYGALMFQEVDPVATRDLIEVMAWPEDVRGKIMSAQQRTTARTALDESLAELLLTVPNPEARSDLVAIAEALTLAELRREPDPASAADAAAARLAALWTIHRTFRVPARLDGDAIATGAEQIRADLKPGSLMADERTAPYQTEADLALAPVQDVQAEGRWATNADESGLVLLHADGEPALKPDGSRFELSWDALVQAGRGSRSERARAGMGALGGAM
ncbi:transglycosylase SLT domain-containing protein [Zavarzinia sp. CC-PAN008]|uniref:transglycosylase SLT domain-containing protein n=1 Tax=Zavarzinia sp. CC-PAN008 TaxID=3243332 RepID=UPI003F748C21